MHSRLELRIEQAIAPSQREAIRTLFLEYQAYISINLGFQRPVCGQGTEDLYSLVILEPVETAVQGFAIQRVPVNPSRAPSSTAA